MFHWRPSGFVWQNPMRIRIIFQCHFSILTPNMWVISKIVINNITKENSRWNVNFLQVECQELADSKSLLDPDSICQNKGHWFVLDPEEGHPSCRLKECEEHDEVFYGGICGKVGDTSITSPCFFEYFKPEGQSCIYPTMLQINPYGKGRISACISMWKKIALQIYLITSA